MRTGLKMVFTFKGNNLFICFWEIYFSVKDIVKVLRSNFTFLPELEVIREEEMADVYITHVIKSLNFRKEAINR